MNSARIRQSRSDSGLGFLTKVLKTFEVVPSSRGSGRVKRSQLETMHGGQVGAHGGAPGGDRARTAKIGYMSLHNLLQEMGQAASEQVGGRQEGWAEKMPRS